MAAKFFRSIFLTLFFGVLSVLSGQSFLAADDQNLDAQLDASMKELGSLTKEMKQANDELNQAMADLNDQGDPRVGIRLAYPLGKSAKVFTEGWTFGAEAGSIPSTGEGDMQVRDLSSEVQWEGTGTFTPSKGSRSRPVFSAPGDNTIILSLMVDGQKITKTYHVIAVSPAGYARVGSKARCMADTHHCPACPHVVVGYVKTGSPNVMIDGKPAAREGDTGTHMSCCGPNTFTISKGDPEVLIDGRPAAKIDPGYGQTKHCGGVGSLVEA